jgi:hypothetical protein
MSKTRQREAAKVQTPADMWARLNKLQRATLDVMGEEEPVGAPAHVIQALVDWWLVVPRARGHVLTHWGIQTRDHGRANP